jgi:transcriptional regulator with XRE-family HTH domain
MSTTTPTLAADIGNRIRTRRKFTLRPSMAKSLGGPIPSMSVAELAKAAEISRQALTRVELGQQLPTIETLVALANALDCEVAELLPGRKQKSDALAELVTAASPHTVATIKRVARELKETAP